MNTLREKIAREIERKTIGSSEDWSEDELLAWCRTDPFGKKSFMKSLAIADHLINEFKISER